MECLHIRLIRRWLFGRDSEEDHQSSGQGSDFEMECSSKLS